MRAGGELRGSSYDRQVRKLWLLRRFGDGTCAPCVLGISDKCPSVLTAQTLTVDRIRPGRQGGRYVRGNIIPGCLPCNQHRGDKPLAAVVGKRRAAQIMRMARP